MDTLSERKKINKANSSNSFRQRDLGVPTWKFMLWFFVSAIFFSGYLNPFSGIRIFLLRLFGAKVGKKCNIKPGVHIRYPWNLEMGDYVAIGEEVWIESYGKIVIGNQVTISQEAMILTGYHNFWDADFNGIVTPLTTLEEGVWICSKAIVGPGAIICESHSILSAGSVLNKSMKPYTIYVGNPAKPVSERIII